MTRVMARLTPNEHDLLRRLASGQKMEEIAQEWGLHPRSAYRTLVRARKNLGAKTDVHAVAIWLGWESEEVLA